MPSVPFSVTDTGLALPAHLLDDVFVEQRHNSRRTLITSAGVTHMRDAVKRLVKAEDGSVAEARLNDYGVAMEIEHPEHQDALIRPRMGRISLRLQELED